MGKIEDKLQEVNGEDERKQRLHEAFKTWKKDHKTAELRMRSQLKAENEHYKNLLKIEVEKNEILKAQIAMLLEPGRGGASFIRKIVIISLVPLAMSAVAFLFTIFYQV